MNVLCIDDAHNLTLKLDPIPDDDVRKNLMDWLKFSPFIYDDDSWIFKKQQNKVKFVSIVDQTEKKFKKLELHLESCKELKQLTQTQKENSLVDVVDEAQKIKDICPICDKKWSEHEETQLEICQTEFQPETGSKFIRPLLNHQKKSVQHLIELGHGANFSVPGSGKTTVTYAAISRWMDDGIINKILVIGPTPSFEPWESEYEQCFGEPHDSKRISGTDANELSRLDYPMFLMHFATVMSKTKEIIEFLEKPDNRVVVIIDESHNIKNIHEDAKWAEAVRKIAPHATRRVILSGTPMPNNAVDLWVQFDFLWPYDKILGKPEEFKRYTKNNGIGKWKPTVTPLFTRIKKSELGLDPPEFRRYFVDMQPTQLEIYNILAEETLDEIYNFRDRGHLQDYRKAKMIRMLQVASNPALLYEQKDEFRIHDEYGYDPKISLPTAQSLDSEIYEKIKNYSDSKEIPSKLVQVEKLTRELLKNGEKVIIWSNFLKNIRVLEWMFKDLNPFVISGDISKDKNDDVNRDNSIKKFKNDKNPQILIATPPALAESVSLHVNKKLARVCGHAIYLDRNFNGAQFIQSMDRIHRVGMDLKDKSSFTINYADSKGNKTFKRNQVYYHFFISNDTIDEDIDKILWKKFENMNEALDDEWPLTLDYDGESTIISKNQSESDFNALVTHLQKLHSLHKETHDN